MYEAMSKVLVVGGAGYIGSHMVKMLGRHGCAVTTLDDLSSADQEGQLGERHEPETHLIPLVLQAAFGRRPHIGVFGRDYDTPDGTCVRDYIHIEDLCSAHWLALQSLMGGAGKRLNSLKV